MHLSKSIYLIYSTTNIIRPTPFSWNTSYFNYTLWFSVESHSIRLTSLVIWKEIYLFGLSTISLAPNVYLIYVSSFSSNNWCNDISDLFFYWYYWLAHSSAFPFPLIPECPCTSYGINLLMSPGTYRYSQTSFDVTFEFDKCPKCCLWKSDHFVELGCCSLHMASLSILQLGKRMYTVRAGSGFRPSLYQVFRPSLYQIDW